MRLVLLASIALLFSFTSGLKSDFQYWVSGLQPKHRKTWVLLVAGSNEWINYRHQADVCRAYQIVKAHGISPDNIVTMMYDDIAYNEENPYKGQIFNEPNGPNVYQDVIIDYKGENITKENVLAVLTGNRTAVKGGNGRVLESTADDNIFVYFADHGAPDLIALYASELTKALQQMYDNKQYKRLVFYLETCESGSMFLELPNNINVYAVTAANATQSSWGTYCDEEVKGLDVCLGDEFSVSWMEDVESEDLTLEELGLQYKITAKKVSLSHVCRFGDLSIMSHFVAEFMGWDKPEPKLSVQKSVNQKKNRSLWPSRDIPLMQLQRAMKKETDVGRKAKLAARLENMKAKRQYLDNFMRDFVETFVAHDNIAFENIFVKQPEKITQKDCYQTAVDAFAEKCFSLGKNPYALKYVYTFANLCESRHSARKIVEHINNKCSNIQMHDIH